MLWANLAYAGPVIAVTSISRSRPTIRFRGRSLMAIVLAPQPPIAEWTEDLDALLERSPGFFANRPVILDVAALPLPPHRPALRSLMGEFKARGIRVMALEGADASWRDPDVFDLPPDMAGLKTTGDIALSEGAPAFGSAAASASAAGPAAQAEKAPASLLLDKPVRSGQSIVFPDGDIIVVGSVSSGAELIAGGSIHVYGALRGRAIAGSAGNHNARIFCRSLEAELLAIDGLYRTTDDMEPHLRGRPIQAWLDGKVMMAVPLD